MLSGGTRNVLPVRDRTIDRGRHDIPFGGNDDLDIKHRLEQRSDGDGRYQRQPLVADLDDIGHRDMHFAFARQGRKNEIELLIPELEQIGVRRIDSLRKLVGFDGSEFAALQGLQPQARCDIDGHKADMGRDPFKSERRHLPALIVVRGEAEHAFERDAA